MKRTNRRKFIGGLVSGLAAVPLLSACGGTPTPAPAPKPAGAPPTPTLAPAPKPAATQPAAAATPRPSEEKAGEIVNVVMGADKQSHDALAQAYMKANPGVKVRNEYKSGNVDEQLQWIRAQFAAGVPNVSILNSPHLRDLIQEGKILNQAPYLSRVNPYTGKRWSDGFEDWSLELVRDPTTGEMYTCPNISTKTFWIYNKRMFAEAGITQIPSQPTWSELIGWCQKIKAKGYIPIALAGTVNRIWTGGDGPAWFVRAGADQYTRDQINIIRAQKGDWAYREGIDDKWKYDPTDPRNDDPSRISVNIVRHLKALRDKELRFNTDAWAEYIGQLNQLMGPQGYTPPGWLGTQDAYPLFLSQRAAMICKSGQILTSFERDIRKLAQGQFTYGTAEQGRPTPTPSQAELSATVFDYGMFNFASMEGPNVKGKSRANELTAGYLAVPKKDRRQNDLEMDFVMFWTSPAGMTVYVKNLLDPNNLNSGGVSGPMIIKGVELPTDVADKFKVLQFIGNYEKPGNPGDAVARGFFKHQPSQRDWVDMMQSMFRGEIQPRQFADKYQKLLEDQWADLMKYMKVTNDDLNHPEKRPPDWKASGPY